MRINDRHEIVETAYMVHAEGAKRNVASGDPSS